MLLTNVCHHTPFHDPLKKQVAYSEVAAVDPLQT